MVIFKDHKVAFLFPPKTGSTTAAKFLMNSKDAVVFDDRHATPIRAIKLEPNLSEYKVYSFLRNPAERFISGVLMFKEYKYTQQLMKIFSRDDIADYKDFIEVYYERHKNQNFANLLYPQATYFNTDLEVIALDFDNYGPELRKATVGLGLDDFPIGWENKGAYDGKKEMAEKVISYVKTKYAEDCELWFQKFGRRIDA
jgi:hypothetical protein